MNANDRAITGFAMAGHGMVHVFELSIPILMTVWLVEFPVTAATLGAIVGVGYGLFGLGALPGGVLVDRVGGRTMIVACLFGMGGSFLALAVVPGVAGIAVGLALWGLTASVYHPAGLSLISNGVEERGRAFAYHGMAANVGTAAGPFATALLLVAFDWQTAAMALALPALATALVGLNVEFDETAAVDVAADGGDAPSADVDSLGEFVSASRGLFTVGFLTVLALVLFNGLYYRGMLTFLPDLLGEFLDPLVGTTSGAGIGLFADGAFAREFDLSQYLYAGLLAVGIGGQYVGGRLTEALDPEQGLAVMLTALVAIGLLFVPAAETLPTLLAVSVALGFALFAMQPLSQATVAKYSPAEHRGLSFGYTYLAIFGLGAIGASTTGAALTYATPAVAFLSLAGFATVALVLALSLLRWDSRASSSTE
ncbi:Sugar phosphate permease [Halomicrobium zhouii]|uniref:Sugar phosphate permease n=1 Tax=Halomicrobium zhouii TaxID=767519 RepID=A0A1I6LWX3_9EURY|nr:MFS transporter [Halomicrobium zhouii]SFS07956.1 Sugar phosphate permease [Halomicrobium zhouii]